MTLKTLTGPTIRDALADARRLFGPGVVMLQSSPPAAGQPASVTVAFDEAPAPRSGPHPSIAAPRRAAPAAPQPIAQPVARPYGYGDVRNVRPHTPEPAAAWAADASEVERLRQRLDRLETELARVRASHPSARRPPLVLVGPSGSGKTSLALRLALAPETVGAERVAVLVVASDAPLAVDPAPAFRAAGVAVETVRTADDVREAAARFGEADLVVVDTPSLPLDPARARPVVARLGEVLAPLEDVKVHLVLDATRSRLTFGADALDALGLAPNALALTRLDEAPDAGAPWAAHLGLPVRVVSLGPDAGDLALATPPEPAPAPAPTPTASAPRPNPLTPASYVFDDPQRATPAFDALIADALSPALA